MSAKETDQREEYPSTFLEYDGTSLKAGLDVVRKWGAALEEELPWDGGLATLPPDDVQPLRQPAPDHGLLQPRHDRYGPHRLRGVAQVAARERPGAGPDRAGHELPHLHRRPDDVRRRPVNGSHAAALYGYTPDHFLLRSSWGTDWGDEGYARLSLDYAAQAVIESYGVMV